MKYLKSAIIFTLIACVFITVLEVSGQTTFSPLFTSPALSIPMSVMFDLHGATIHCADGTFRHNISTSQYAFGSRAALYSEAPLSHIVGTLSPGEGKITFHLLWVHVSDDGNHYKLKGLWHDQQLYVCPGSDIVFPVDITGTCDGSIFAMTTPRINGYSISANSTQVSAGCIHP